MTLTSFSSGAVVATSGSTRLNQGSIVPALPTAAAPAWLALRCRGAQNLVST